MFYYDLFSNSILIENPILSTMLNLQRIKVRIDEFKRKEEARILQGGERIVL
jgi:hypothetical protein